MTDDRKDAEAAALRVQIERLENQLAALTGEPRYLLGARAAAEILGIGEATMRRALRGEVSNGIKPRVIILGGTPVYGISREDLRLWTPGQVGRPKTG